MYSAKDIASGFPFAFKQCAENENFLPAPSLPVMTEDPKQIFTTSEMTQLYGLIKPYMENGDITELSLKKGRDASSLAVFNNVGLYGNNVAFTVVKFKKPDEAIKYTMNFPATRLNLETLNFPELMRVCRLQLAVVYGAPKSAEFRIV